MSSVNAKSAVGRQSQLPLKRAFLISLNSVKIRFWRSIITAGGIFLGIAFFAVVLTQGLMQWPIVEKVDPGNIRIEGQVNAPNDYEVWKPIPVDAGIKAGIPENVVDRAAKGGATFSLARIVKGQLDYERDQKMLKQLRGEWAQLKQIKDTVAFYVDASSENDVKVSDAVKYGVPKNVIKKVAGKSKTVNGADIVDMIREDPAGMKSFHVMALLDQDISVKDGVAAGVPETVAKKLAGEGRTFKAGALNDAINEHPDLMKLWENRERINFVYTKASKDSIKSLGKVYAFNLGEIISESKGFAKDARKAQIMIVNKDRRVSVDYDKAKASSIRLEEGDNILVPDMNSYYRMWWLLVMSLLVCSVGISNSMLMAVTERFKEIGTMKCLGALDSFVVILFMLESGMMGVFASVLGWLVGFGSIMVFAGMSKGWNIISSIQPIEILTTFVLSVVVGLLITIVATIAPALRAANMPAAIALRSEI